MRRSIMTGLVLAALSAGGCKSDQKSGETAASGSALTGSSTVGSGSSTAGSGSSMTGSGSSVAGSGSTTAGSGSAAGSGVAEVGPAGGGDPACEQFAARFASCKGVAAEVRASMAKVFEGLKTSPKAKVTCEHAAKGWNVTLTKAGC